MPITTKLDYNTVIKQIQAFTAVPLEDNKDTNLIELGLDSLHIMQLLNQWRSQGASVTFAKLIENPSLAEWLSLLLPEQEAIEEEKEQIKDLSARLHKDSYYSEQPFALTDVQYAYWIGRQENQELGNVGCHAYLEIDGSNVTAAHLEHAWHTLITQHSMLRARFNDEGQQYIAEDYPLPVLKVHDLRQLSHEETEQHAREIRNNLSHRKLDIENGQVMGIELTQFAENSTRIHFDIDLLVADVQSLQILLRDLAEAYQKPANRRLKADPNWRFAHYLAVEKERHSDKFQQDKEYWQRRLATLPSAPQLPLARDPQSVSQPEFVRRSYFLEQEKWNNLKKLAAKFQLTPAVVLANAYAAVLSRWSSEPEFLLNVPLFDRQMDHPGIEDVVADFTNLLLLECNFRTPRSFLEQSKQLQSQLHNDLAHAGYSAVNIQRDLARQGRRDGVSAPVVFACNLGTALLTESCRKTFGSLNYMISQTPQVWLDHQIYEMDNGLLLAWDAVDALFPVQLIDDMFAAYTSLLAGLAEEENNWHQVSQIPLPNYQVQQRYQSNKTNSPAKPRLLHQGMFKIAAQTPQRTALIDGDNPISYAELAESALRIATLLYDNGFQPGDCVAVTLPKGSWQIRAVFGILAAGGCYVPIGIQQPTARQARIHQSAGIRLLLSDTEHATSIYSDNITRLDITQSCELPPLTLCADTLPNQSAYIIFTSGSTGEPKGVEITHQAAANTIDDINTRYNVHANSRVLAVSALDFDLSVYDIFGLLNIGGAVVLIDESQRRDADAWMALINNHKITVWNSVPILLEMLIVVAENLQQQLPFEQVLLSGDWIGLDLPPRLLALTQANIHLAAMGGATEAAIWSNTFDTFKTNSPLPAHWRSIPYGKPLANQCYRVVDSHGQDCPDWVAGELWIGGDGLAKGYRGDAALTSERFVNITTDTVHDSATHQRWYRTGDQGRYWPDGNLEFLGRLDQQVKVRGHRIELGEVETALMTLANIERAVALTITPTGQPATLAAAVILNTKSTLDCKAVLAELQQLLPDYMVPSTLLAMPQIPLSTNGKIDRKEITAQLTKQQSSQIEQLTAPETKVEIAVAKIWQQLLPTEQIGRESNFFTLGGDSLLATQAVSALRQQGLNAEQPLRLLFAKPVLAEFAAQLKQREACKPVLQIIADPDNRYEPFPLTEIQRAYWMGQSPGLPLNCGTHYLVELDGENVDLKQFEKAWNNLVNYHEMLRAIVTEDGQQKILPDIPAMKIKCKSLVNEQKNNALTAQHYLHKCWDTQQQVVQSTTAKYPNHRIDAVSYNGQQGELRHRIGIIFDYLTLDGFSIKLLLEQLATLYSKPEQALRIPALSFRDYVNQVKYSKQEKQQAINFWQQKIKTLPMAATLPLAQDPTTLSKATFKRREAKLNAEQWLRLKEKARENQITPSVLLLVAYSHIIRMWNSGHDHTLNLTLFDRQDVHHDINHLLGDFTSLAPIGFYKKNGNSLLEQARATQQEIAEALENKAISSIWIQRERARQMSMTATALPIVFTSTLGLGNGLFENKSANFPEFASGGMSETPQVWLDHQLYEYNGELALSWDAVDSLFPANMLNDMFNSYLQLLDDLVEQDWKQEFQLPLPPQQTLTRRTSNNSNKSYQSRLLHQKMFSIARHSPQRIALIDDDNHISYGELADSALRIAQLLQNKGLQPGEAVAITLPKGYKQVCAVFGILAAGGCYVPIGTQQPISRQARIYKTAAIRLVLTDSKHMLSVADNVTCINIAQAEGVSPLSGYVDIPTNQSAYIIFTSGSTGEPKGVEMTHQATANTVDDINTRYAVHAQSKVLAVSALDFDLSVYDLFGPLSAGGAIVLINDSQRRDATAWLQLIRKHKITIWNSVPILLDMLMVVAESQNNNSAQQLPFEQVLLSGDWIGLDLPPRLFALAPSVKLAAMGGATEAAIWSNTFDSFAPEAILSAQWRSIPYGKPLANQYYRVVDAHGRDCPDWVAGELWIGGAGLAKGYCGDASLTAERFISAASDTTADKTTPQRWYRTGDQGRYWPDGNLEFLGRLDHQVKVRGHRIELGEVETALISLANISRAVAVTISTAQQPTTLAAAIVLNAEDKQCSPADYPLIKKELQQLLPDYMVPDTMLAVEELPLSANGKVDRKQITTLLAQQHSVQPQQLTPPQTAAEAAVAKIWQKLLPAELIGRETNFFTLGGDSLLATQAIAILQQQGLNAEQPLRLLFAKPVLAEFAAELEVGKISQQQIIPKPADRHKPFPLTEIQQAYWMGQSPGLALNCGTHYLVELDGKQVDIERLEQAWNSLVKRHEMLRVVIDEHGQQQTIKANATPYRIQAATHQYGSLSEAKEQIQNWWERLSQNNERTLFAIKVVNYGKNQCRLALLFNYQTLDGYSIKLLVNELAMRYQNPMAILPEFEVSFRDYVTQIQPEPQAVERAKAYWLKKLEALPLAPSLPLAKDPCILSKPQFRRREARLNQKSWKALRHSAQQQGITPSVVVLVAYAEILSQWSGGSALTINMTLFDRQPVHPDINKIVGDFTSLAPVAYYPDKNSCQLELAQQLQEEVASALENRELSSIWIQRERAKTMDRTAAALPVVFTSTLGIADDLLAEESSNDFPELAGGGLSETPQVWLDHQMYESQGELLITWDSVDELFPKGMLDEMFTQFIQLIESMTRQWMSPFKGLLPVTQQKIREQVNATTTSIQPRLLHQTLFEIARRTPQNVALIDTNNYLSYGELADSALRIARLLQNNGHKPGEAVAVTLPKGIEQVCAVFGILAAGGCYVPIGVQQPATRQAKIHNTAKIRLVLTDAEHALSIPSTVTCLDIAQARNLAPLNSYIDIPTTQSAYIIFTSGSTGEPKGVEMSHQATANTIDDINSRYAVHADSRVLAVSALDFDLSVYDLFGLLSVGGAIVLINDGQRRDAAAWLELIRKHKITIWNSVPVLLEMLMVVAESQDNPPLLPFEQVFLSGDWIAVELPARLFALAPTAQLAAMGGATEAAIWSNSFDAFNAQASLPAHWTSIPYGKPLANQRYRVVDAHGRDCPDWVTGELWIGGNGLAKGYRGDEMLTSKRFVTLTSEDTTTERWYRTGDLGRYWPDGTLEFLGRLDQQVKVRGHRIELGEVETALMSLANINRAVAVTISSAGHPAALAAAIQVKNKAGKQADLNLEESKAELQQLLPDYMVPATLVVMEHIPLSANGKVDRKQIAQQLAKQMQHCEYEPPCNELEIQIAEIWCQTLNQQRISRNDDFFTIGGDSLSATQIVQQLQQQRISPENVSLITLFTSPTIAALATHIRGQWFALSTNNPNTDFNAFEEGSL